MNKSPYLWSIISGIFFIVLASLAFLINQHSQKSIQLNAQIAAALDVEGSTDLAIAELLEKLSFSLYEGAKDRIEKHTFLVMKAAEEKQKANQLALVFFVLTSAWLLLIYFISHKNNKLNLFWRQNLFIAILCLAVGLFAPMMEMTASKDVPVLGDVVFKYEAKSIYSTVQSLFAHGSFVIGVLILLFSIVTPLLKMCVVAMSLFDIAPALHKRAHHLIHLLGKWSMADVFVVAILISIFALDTQDFTRAETGLGVYFFATYCVLSLLVTHAVLKEDDLQRIKKVE